MLKSPSDTMCLATSDPIFALMFLLVTLLVTTDSYDCMALLYSYSHVQALYIVFHINRGSTISFFHIF